MQLFFFLLVGFTLGARIEFVNNCDYKVQVVRMDWDGYQEEQAALAPKEHKSGEFAPTMYYQFTNGFESNGSVAFFIILPDDQAMYYLLAGHNFTTPMRIETQSGPTISCMTAECPKVEAGCQSCNSFNLTLCPGEVVNKFEAFEIKTDRKSESKFEKDLDVMFNNTIV